jgi:hypothetical protein
MEVCVCVCVCVSVCVDRLSDIYVYPHSIHTERRIKHESWVWWHKAVISALRWVGQENIKFEASLCDVERPCSIKKHENGC